MKVPRVCGKQHPVDKREHQWHYVDTTENPVDYASRGLRAFDILSTNWLSGPEFLWKKSVKNPFQQLT